MQIVVANPRACCAGPARRPAKLAVKRQDPGDAKSEQRRDRSVLEQSTTDSVPLDPQPLRSVESPLVGQLIEIQPHIHDNPGLMNSDPFVRLRLSFWPQWSWSPSFTVPADARADATS